MRKKILGAIELLVIGLIAAGILSFYKETNSTPRFNTEFDWIRIIIDLVLISTLMFRVIKVVKTYKFSYDELGRPRSLEKMIYMIYLTSLIPDLSIWLQWSYFSGLYLYVLAIFISPIFLWGIEFIKRITLEPNNLEKTHYRQ
ncbi:hypothetical protein [Lewinella cohaerens]|uniref:hypothetical protein n=1 Tax=Lewinella cohaerens TaxID=70995 RepID=UPI00036411A4|nr:hypothetical protein [Lewinella cohaerens]